MLTVGSRVRDTEMSIDVSTEAGGPLLDDEVVSLSARIPPSLTLKHATQKNVYI